MNLSLNFNKSLVETNLADSIYELYGKIPNNFLEVEGANLQEKSGFEVSKSYGWTNNPNGNSRSKNLVNIHKSNYFCLCYCCRNSATYLTPLDRQSNQFLITNLDATQTTIFDSSTVIEALVYSEDYKWNTKQITYSFYEDSIFAGSYYNSETGVREVSEPVKNNIRAILNWLENLVDLEFIEITETASNVGTIRYMLSNEPGYAYAYIPISWHPAGGDVHLSSAYDNNIGTNGFQGRLGTHGFMTLIHETLHALGLKHPGNYNGNGLGTGAFLDYERDNTTNTLMSYNFTSSAAATPMPYDILALQYLYGANNNYHQENTFYLFNTVDNYQLGIQDFSGISQIDSKLKSTIWDAGGIDTLDFSALDFRLNGYHLDLREGGIISTTDNYNKYFYRAIGDSSGTLYQTTNFGTAIAYGVTIENAIGSSSDDKIVGNAAINLLEGGNGNDTIEGGMGLDVYIYRPLDSLTSDLDTLVDFELGETLRIYHDGFEISVEEAMFKQDSRELNLNLSFEGSDVSPINLALPNLNSDLLIYEQESVLKLDFKANFIISEEQVENYTDFTFQPRSFLTIGEFGRISNFDHNVQNIELKNNYINPVVFALPLSRNGGEPATVRLTDIGNNSFQAYLQEPEFNDGTHTTEEFSYMVLEAGAWQLEDGTLLEVGTVNHDGLTTSDWKSVDFNLDFDTNPVILSQVQTNQGRQFVRTRQQEAGREGFMLSLEEEEALNATTGHLEESIGWLAIEPGVGSWGNLNYQAGHTERQVDHLGYNWEFSPEFEDIPYVFASLASFYGANPAGLRYQNLTNTQIELVVEEDQSLDSETNHTSEIVDFLAISGSGDLTATAYEPVSSI